MNKLSVVLATFNEEANLRSCLESIDDIVDEIIIVDGGSVDKTVDIAREFKAKVIVTDNPPIFHINKQKALEEARNEWILQLDADERVSQKLKEEIKSVIQMSQIDLEGYQKNLLDKEVFQRVFLKHQRLVEKRDGIIGSLDGGYVAFFIPRLNYFLGKYLKYGGVYPDGVIRLVRRGKAHFPCVSVHEQISVDGKVGWLSNDLLHFADPTFKRYLERNSRYIDLIADELEKENVSINLSNILKYMLLKPVGWFLLTFIRHKGVLDGIPGLIFSVFSSLRFPRAFLRYSFKSRNN